MSYERKPGDFILFKNENRTGNQPHYSGYGLSMDGRKIKKAIWINEAENGKTYITGRTEFDIEKMDSKKPNKIDEVIPF